MTGAADRRALRKDAAHPAFGVADTGYTKCAIANHTIERAEGFMALYYVRSGEDWR
jgi:hypothetical protein